MKATVQSAQLTFSLSVLVVKVKMGTGASATSVSHFVRVINIFDKYYNKWFMSKEAHKVWKKETKRYKLEVRMLDKNPLNQYVDFALVGNDTYAKADICMIVDDKQVVSVVEKCKRLCEVMGHGG